MIYGNPFCINYCIKKCYQGFKYTDNLSNHHLKRSKVGIHFLMRENTKGVYLLYPYSVVFCYLTTTTKKD